MVFVQLTLTFPNSVEATNLNPSLCLAICFKPMLRSYPFCFGAFLSAATSSVRIQRWDLKKKMKKKERINTLSIKKERFKKKEGKKKKKSDDKENNISTKKKKQVLRSSFFYFINSHLSV